MTLLYISIVESLYLSYMFHFFKTTVDFNFNESPTSSFFKHAIGNEYTLRICPFGRYAIILLIFIFLGRNFCYIPFVKTSIIIALILSFMNMNALVYVFPVAFLELFRT